MPNLVMGWSTELMMHKLSEKAPNPLKGAYSKVGQSPLQEVGGFLSLVKE